MTRKMGVEQAREMAWHGQRSGGSPVGAAFVFILGLALLPPALSACGNGGSSGPDGGGADLATAVDSATGTPDSATAVDSATGTPDSATGGDSGSTGSVANAVYTISNDTTDNRVYAYTRAADGSLTALNSYSTGGRGTGSDLGDQGALAYDLANNRIFIVNAGDNSISMMAVNGDGSLTQVAHVGSGGVRPISITFYGDIVYALNAGDASNAGNISGFQVAGSTLTAVGTAQALSAASPNPAQIEFSRDGKFLVVTEKSGKIDTYAVSSAGVASGLKTIAGATRSPFGFEFTATGYLVVSYENGGTTGSATNSSYRLGTDGTLTLINSVPSNQTSSCWVATAGNYAYVANTKSANVSAYSVGSDGTLTLIAGAAGTTGNGAVDLVASSTNDYLYVLANMSHTITVLQINSNGTLTNRSTLSNLPTHAMGLVAR
ncbi:MAG TPA: beta-propeller fold lactonase family protein [Polyangia bacterium]|nr:beta-propeller fold lactonase family protein [Polyangia bacterium]